MIHSPYGTLRRMNRQDLFGRTGKGIRHTGRGEGGDDFASSSSPASSPPKFREMQGLFQCVHYLYFIKLRAFLAALQEAEKCRPFSNRLIFRDLQSGVHFSLLYKKLKNADHFPIVSLSEIYKTTCISRGLTRDRMYNKTGCPKQPVLFADADVRYTAGAAKCSFEKILASVITTSLPSLSLILPTMVPIILLWSTFVHSKRM